MLTQDERVALKQLLDECESCLATNGSWGFATRSGWAGDKLYKLLERDALAGPEVGVWKLNDNEKPPEGARIVKAWKSKGSTWAGVHSGSPKDSSFDQWLLLPPLM